MVAAIQSHPNRFAGFATLPTPDVPTACKELERTVKTLGFKGTMINGHTNGEFLDDKKYWPIFEAAESLDVPVYLHPRDVHPERRFLFRGLSRDRDRRVRLYRRHHDPFPAHDLRRRVRRLPKLKFILGHLGEGIPFALDRVDDHTGLALKRRGLKKTPLQYLKDNLLVTTSGNWYEPAFVCTLLALGADNILFAIDWPYEPNAAGMDFLKSALDQRR